MRSALRTVVLGNNMLRLLQPNLLTAPIDFSNAAWTNTALALTSGQSVSPRNDAWKFQAASNGTLRNLQQTTSQAINSSYKLAVIAHAGSANWIILGNLASSAGDGAVWVNVATGAIGTVQGAGVSSNPSVSLGYGWYLVSMTVATSGAIPGNSIRLYLANADNSITVTTADYIYLLGAQLVKVA